MLQDIIKPKYGDIYTLVEYLKAKHIPLTVIDLASSANLFSDENFIHAQYVSKLKNYRI